MIFKANQVHAANEPVFGTHMQPFVFKPQFEVRNTILTLGVLLLLPTLFGKLFKKMSFFWFLSMLSFLTFIVFLGAAVDYVTANDYLHPYFTSVCDTWCRTLTEDTETAVPANTETAAATNISEIQFFNEISLIFSGTPLVFWIIPFLSFLFHKFKKINLERLNDILTVWAKATFLCLTFTAWVIVSIQTNLTFYVLPIFIVGYLALKKLPLQQKLIVLNFLFTAFPLFATREYTNTINMGLTYLTLSLISIIPCVKSYKSLKNQVERNSL